MGLFDVFKKKNNANDTEQTPPVQPPKEANDNGCNHEWVPVYGEWSEKCSKCGATEPAKFRQREGGVLFPMECVSDSDLDVLLSAMVMKYMVRTAVDGVDNEFRRVHHKIDEDRKCMIDKDEWNAVFLSLTTYASTSPAQCPDMFVGLLKPDKQQYIKDVLFEKWLSLM